MHRAQHARRARGKKLRTLAAVVGLASALVLSLAIPQAMAKTGGIKVDSDHNCFDPIREDNTLLPGQAETGDVWLNLPSGELDGTYTYVIYNNGEQVGSGYLYFTQCTVGNTNYWWATFAVPYVEGGGSVTLVVYQSDPEGTVGADSFRILDLA